MLEYTISVIFLIGLMVIVGYLGKELVGGIHKR